MATVGKSDSVELKLTVADAERRSTITRLELDPLNAQIRQVVFFDTPDLRAEQGGVVVRARRVQGKGDDSTIKLRPVEPGRPVAPRCARPPASSSRWMRCPGGVRLLRRR